MFLLQKQARVAALTAYVGARTTDESACVAQVLPSLTYQQAFQELQKEGASITSLEPVCIRLGLTSLNEEVCWLTNQTAQELGKKP